MANITERSCVICKTKKPKKELFRFAIVEGKPSFDKDQKLPGRSFYICSKECYEQGVSKKKKVKIASRENRFIAIPDVAPGEIVW